MNLYQVEKVKGTEYCSNEGKLEHYFLYEFCIGDFKTSLTFKSLDFEELESYYNDDDRSDFVYEMYSERNHWDLSNTNEILLIGKIA